MSDPRTELKPGMKKMFFFSDDAIGYRVLHTKDSLIERIVQELDSMTDSHEIEFEISCHYMTQKEIEEISSKTF